MVVPGPALGAGKRCAKPARPRSSVPSRGSVIKFTGSIAWADTERKYPLACSVAWCLHIAQQFREKAAGGGAKICSKGAPLESEEVR